MTYHNPLDNVKDLAHHFFKRCLEANVVPYVVTKKTVFKWQEGFWTTMKVSSTPLSESLVHALKQSSRRSSTSLIGKPSLTPDWFLTGT